MNAASAIACRRFYEEIEARGGRVIEGCWLGAKRPHRIICSEGHETAPRPSDVINKGTRCIVCTGNDQATAWRLFCQLVAEHGGHVLEPQPLGVNTPHRILCPERHETTARPADVRRGGGICRVCAPTSVIGGERRFRELVTTLGGVIIEPVWLGNKVRHRVICGQGHKTAPRPNDVQQTKSLCRICAGHDSATSWREFKARVAELGGSVTEPEWLGNKKPHRVICKEGHGCTVRPNNVQQGSGFCRTCAYKVWDIFYVVANSTEHQVKFGVTSHDPRARLRFHEVDGFRDVIRTITGLPGAGDLERAVLAALRLAAFTPVRGREYYDAAALPVILDIADNWVATAA